MVNATEVDKLGWSGFGWKKGSHRQDPQEMGSATVNGENAVTEGSGTIKLASVVGRRKIITVVTEYYFACTKSVPTLLMII